MKREIVVVCGVTGSGKTEWSRQFTASFSRFFVYDILGDFPNVRYTTGEDIANFTESPQPQFRLGVHSPYDVDILASAAYVLGNCWLTLEEISTLFSVGARVKGPIQESVLLGRHRALSMLIITQRVAYIPVTIRSQLSRIVSFRQQEPNDLKWLEDFIGKRSKTLPSFPDLHCIDWHKGDVREYGITYIGNNIHSHDAPG